MNVVAVLFGRRGSKGMPGKNTTHLLGRPACAYPLIAVSGITPHAYVSTDDPEIARVGRSFGAEIIDRPAHLCRDDSALEDAIRHAFDHVMTEYPADLFVLLQANAPCVRAESIARAVRQMRERPELDSVATVMDASAFAPYRARRLAEDGTLRPLAAGNADAKGDRAGNEPVYFCDGGAYVVRSSTLAAIETNPGPYRWQGRQIGAVKQAPSTGDIDHPWQIPVIEWWLGQHGFTHARPVSA